MDIVLFSNPEHEYKKRGQKEGQGQVGICIYVHRGKAIEWKEINN